ncbi:hypothetical protein NPIL_507611 [Nephila pilipes]|uniref:Uncharacterized protein n=1 Tax=Nephila pilipes TaxID=299642 RepID=A0A8X6NW57_NEPPI|nr:hypothetical protein NPIL_507611 [Nephila pilipes]
MNETVLAMPLSTTSFSFHSKYDDSHTSRISRLAASSVDTDRKLRCPQFSPTDEIRMSLRSGDRDFNLC